MFGGKEMEIILQHKGKEQNYDCIVQYGKGVKAGETVCGFSERGENAVFIGVAGIDDEAYEDSLFCGLKGAMAIAEKAGYHTVAVDVDSFVPEISLTSYILNVFLDCLIEHRASTPSFDREFRLLYADRQAEELLLRDVEDAVFAPVKVYENHSFGDYGDPLKKEFHEFVQDFSEQKTFREYLLALIDKKGFRKYSDAYKKCGVSKSTFSKITNFASDDYKPSKGTVAAFAIGLELDLAEAQKLFHAAGYHLDRTEKMDQIVRFFIEKKIYDIQEVNCCMDYFGVPLLGEHCRDDAVRLG